MPRRQTIFNRTAFERGGNVFLLLNGLKDWVLFFSPRAPISNLTTSRLLHQSGCHISGPFQINYSEIKNNYKKIVKEIREKFNNISYYPT